MLKGARKTRRIAIRGPNAFVGVKELLCETGWMRADSEERGITGEKRLAAKTDAKSSRKRV